MAFSLHLSYVLITFLVTETSKSWALEETKNVLKAASGVVNIDVQEVSAAA
jgi:hypothetical protein